MNRRHDVGLFLLIALALAMVALTAYQAELHLVQQISQSLNGLLEPTP